MDQVAEEQKRRDEMRAQLLSESGPNNVPPDLIRKLGIYGGAAGIWVDLKRTLEIDQSGITVGVLHTGSTYPDDISESDILYHYPTTQRSGHDESEIEATKTAARLRTPVFVITHSNNGKLRDVRKARVVDWDDAARVFLLSFWDVESIAPLPSLEEEENSTFALTSGKSEKKRMTNARDGQPDFKFRVLRRYGPKCAVCPINVSELLDAAHICEKRDAGSDDSRNGLVLCATHHRAFDRGLFAIEPETLRIALRAGRMTCASLGINVDSLKYMARTPHADAIGWRWQRWAL